MGPTIILDKSALQGLSLHAIYELDRYFCPVIAPVLSLEILADLKKNGIDPEKAERLVVKIAVKAQALTGKTNAHYQTLCLANLLGRRHTIDYRPVVTGGRRIRLQDGRQGIFHDGQPESEALLRWACGRFAEAEELLATRWRSTIASFDLDRLRAELLANLHWAPIPNLETIKHVITELFALPELPPKVVSILTRQLRFIPEVEEWALQRWEMAGRPCFPEFAPYACHCVRVMLAFQLGLIHNLITTRRTNWIDLEYFYYTPFAHIFCSGDNFHRDLATVLLDDKQSFVSKDELRAELQALSEARHATSKPESVSAPAVVPADGSLIRRLWIKHLGHWPDPPPGIPQNLAEDKKQLILQKVKPFMDAVQSTRKDVIPPPRWPCP